MRRTLTALALGGTLALTLTACGGSNSTGNSGSGGSGGGGASSSAPQAEATPVAALTSLTGKMTQVTVDPSFLMGAKSLGLTVGLVGKATLTNGVLSFPITGGDATYYTPGSRDPYVESSIKHEGSGISLTGGGTKVELTNFTVDAGKSMLYADVSANGKSAAKQAPVFFLDGSTLKPLDTTTEAGFAILAGTKVSLTKTAATLLDTTFKTTALKEFFPVGVAKITLALPAK